MAEEWASCFGDQPLKAVGSRGAADADPVEFAVTEKFLHLGREFGDIDFELHDHFRFRRECRETGREDQEKADRYSGSHTVCTLSAVTM